MRCFFHPEEELVEISTSQYQFGIDIHYRCAVCGTYWYRIRNWALFPSDRLPAPTSWEEELLRVYRDRERGELGYRPDPDYRPIRPKLLGESVVKDMASMDKETYLEKKHPGYDAAKKYLATPSTDKETRTWAKKVMRRAHEEYDETYADLVKAGLLKEGGGE